MDIALCVVLAVATIGLYLPAVSHSFLALDDSDYVTANAHVQHGLDWSTIRWAFTTDAAANWHPLTWLSHALDYQLFGLNPAGHHFSSVLLHALNVVLLFLLLNWITGRRGPSLLVAALFALHPINVESVAWVAERKNVLCTLFFLLAIAAYSRYAEKPDWRRYLLVLILFAAGLMAKPMVITLPFLLLLLDYWPLGRISGSPAYALRVQQFPLKTLLLEKVPLLLLSAASAVITFKVQRAGAAVRSLVQFPFSLRIQNALIAYTLYLWKMLWPTRLAFYPHSAISPPAWRWLPAALLLLAITAVVFVFRRKRYLVVGWFWYLGTLVPVIGLVQLSEASMADRYAYLPLIGIFIMIAFGLADVATLQTAPLAWKVTPAIAALLVLMALTYRQIGYWASDYALWSHANAVAENPFAHDAMGSALLDPNLNLGENDADLDTTQKRLDAARHHFERALFLRSQLAQQNPAAYLPDMATTLNNLGNLDRLENRPDQARQDYEAALNLHRRAEQSQEERYPPDVAVTLNNLATLERDTGHLPEASQHFEQALAIYRQMAQQNPDAGLPKAAATLNSLALVEREQKQLDQSRQHYEQALQVRRQLAQQDPDANLAYLAITLNDLGILDGLQGRTDDARAHYEEALQTYRRLAQSQSEIYLPYLAATLNNLALTDESQNRMAESREHFTEDLAVYRKLQSKDPDRYSRDVARVEASLAEVEQKAGLQ